MDACTKRRVDEISLFLLRMVGEPLLL